MYHNSRCGHLHAPALERPLGVLVDALRTALSQHCHSADSRRGPGAEAQPSPGPRPIRIFIGQNETVRVYLLKRN
jgi:hypothetical protein